MQNRDDLLRFFKLLYGDNPPGWLIIWTLPDRRTCAFQGNEMELAVDHVFAESASKDVYFGIGLQKSKPLLGRRGQVEGVIALPGLWMDIDIQGPKHISKHLPKSVDEVTEFLMTLQIKPTIVIDSGGGFQVHWLFQSPWLLNDESDREKAQILSRKFQQNIIIHGSKKGWKLDNTADLARILRPPGTLNHKYTPLKPCMILEMTGTKYNLSDIEAYLSSEQPYETECINSIPKGKRNTSLTSRGGKLRYYGFSKDAIEAALKIENRNSCLPPLPEKEVDGITKSISRYPSAYDKKDKPIVVLFKDGTDVTISDTASRLGDIYSGREILFKRSVGSNMFDCRHIYTIDENRKFEILKPPSACSAFESVANISFLKKAGNELVPVHAILKEADTRRILESKSFHIKLPSLTIITKCPVIVKNDAGELYVVTGYDRRTGIYAEGTVPDDLNYEDSINLVLSLTEEFDFETAADKSRFLAHLMSPAFVMSRFCGIRAPIFAIEADESQAGKGYMTKLQAAIYNDIPCVINRQQGGVGSLDESLNQALIQGYNFINIDNLSPHNSDTFHSDKLCSVMTEDTYSARMPKVESVIIDPSCFVIQMTTNGCTLSIDLMNRCAPVKIRKKHNHDFIKFPEGDLLNHVKKNQPKYLGAIFAIIKKWHANGMVRTSIIAHGSSFTSWFQIMDELVQNYLFQAPLMDNYNLIRNRMTNPDMQWVRGVTKIVIDIKGNEVKLTTPDIADLIISGILPMPFGESADRSSVMNEGGKEKLMRYIGTIFSNCFKRSSEENILELDDYQVERMKEKKPYTYGNHTTNKDVNCYVFRKTLE